MEEAKKRDHRKLGKELELFTFSEKVGMGLPLWLPKGTALRERLEEFMRKLRLKLDMCKWLLRILGIRIYMLLPGHYEKYGKDSFQPIHTPQEGEEFFLKADELSLTIAKYITQFTAFISRSAG